MVITEQFAWGHIPRTAGDATHALFRVVSDHFAADFDIDNCRQHLKHDTFAYRGIDDLDLALNIRRLPSIMLSYRAVLIMQGIYPDFQPLPAPSKNDFLNPNSNYGQEAFDRLGMPGCLATMPDRYLESFTDGGSLTISRWMRMENLFEDFVDFISGYYDLTQELVDRLSVMPTKEQLDYDHTVESYFNPDDIATFYSNNPLWRDLEIQVYGDTL